MTTTTVLGVTFDVIDDELQQEIIRLAEKNLSNDEICLRLNIHRGRFYDKLDPEFIKDLNVARRMPVILAKEIIHKYLDNESEKDEPNPEFAMKFLERVCKEEYSLRHDMKVDGSMDVKIINRIPDLGKTD